MMKSAFVALLLALSAWTAHAQNKVAITSLVADSMSVVLRRDGPGSHFATQSTSIKMPGPLLDHSVLKSAQEALEKLQPGVSVAALKVPAAGSNVDPSQLFSDDGQPVAGNVLVEALKQQGFTHLLAASKRRATNVVKLNDAEIVGTGYLEGIGFYLDPSLKVERRTAGAFAQGIIAPYVYIRLRLLDLQTMQVREQVIAANSIATPTDSKESVDPWEALTAQEKMTVLDRLIRKNVAEAMPALMQAK
jgi:hypothetical protein